MQNTNSEFLSVPWAMLLDTEISSTCKLLYSVIAQEQLEDAPCGRTVKELSEIIGVVPLAVTTALRKMQEKGLIIVHKGKSTRNRPQYSYEALVKESV